MAKWLQSWTLKSGGRRFKSRSANYQLELFDDRLESIIYSATLVKPTCFRHTYVLSPHPYQPLSFRPPVGDSHIKRTGVRKFRKGPPPPPGGNKILFRGSA